MLFILNFALIILIFGLICFNLVTFLFRFGQAKTEKFEYSFKPIKYFWIKEYSKVFYP